MKILIVSSFLPFPLFSGGQVRLYNLLKELSQKHEITLVCEKRKHQTQSDVDVVKKVCKDIFVVDRKKQWSAEVVLKTVISSYPFLLAGHDLPEMKKILSQLLKEKQFDVIHVETFYVYQNLPETSLPVVLVEHNIEYNVYERFAKTAPILVKPLLAIDIEKIKYWEKFYWEKATKIVGVSRVEVNKMRSDAVVVPNGVSLSDFPFRPIRHSTQYLLPRSGAAQGKKEMIILFMGDFTWIQNTTTASWIIKDIWPKIEKSVKNKALNVKLWIVGKHIPESLKAYRSENIIFDEHAPNKTSDIYKKADILLAPIKVGGGTSYKILEAMASGVPVVTTSLGLEGLQAKNKTHALTAETSVDLARAVDTLLDNKREYTAIAKNARQFIEKNYSWTEIAKTLEGVYTNAIKK